MFADNITAEADGDSDGANILIAVTTEVSDEWWTGSAVKSINDSTVGTHNPIINDGRLKTRWSRGSYNNTNNNNSIYCVYILYNGSEKQGRSAMNENERLVVSSMKNGIPDSIKPAQ